MLMIESCKRQNSYLPNALMRTGATRPFAETPKMVATIPLNDERPPRPFFKFPRILDLADVGTSGTPFGPSTRSFAAELI